MAFAGPIGYRSRQWAIRITTEHDLSEIDWGLAVQESRLNRLTAQFRPTAVPFA
jgi:hypothetical protein